MKHKTSKLEGALLDAAVAKAEGFRLMRFGRAILIDSIHHRDVDDFEPDETPNRYSADWSCGGPLIEREGIACSRFEGWYANVRPLWNDHLDRDESDGYGEGETLLLAAMRAYVASKFGDEVELP